MREHGKLAAGCKSHPAAFFVETVDGVKILCNLALSLAASRVTGTQQSRHTMNQQATKQGNDTEHPYALVDWPAETKVTIVDKSIVITNVRIMQEHLTKAYSYDQDKEPKYSVTVAFPKAHESTYTALADILTRIDKKYGLNIPMVAKDGTVDVEVISDSTFLHDGDIRSKRGTRRGQPRFPGQFYITTGTKFRPMVYDQNDKLVSNLDKACYRGSFVDLVLTPWVVSENKGSVYIPANVNAVMHSHDGPRLSSGFFDADKISAATGRNLEVGNYGTESQSEPEGQTQQAQYPRDWGKGPNTQNWPRSDSQATKVNEFDDFDDDIPF